MNFFLEKKIDRIFDDWICKTHDLGYDEIHYLALKALSTYTIYAKLKNSVKTKTKNIQNEGKNFSEIYKANLDFLVDWTCPSVVKDILQSMGCDYVVKEIASYKGKKIV